MRFRRPRDNADFRDGQKHRPRNRRRQTATQPRSWIRSPRQDSAPGRFHARQPIRRISASFGGVTSPGHISLQAATTSEEIWSTTVIAPQQAVAACRSSRHDRRDHRGRDRCRGYRHDRGQNRCRGNRRDEFRHRADDRRHGSRHRHAAASQPTHRRHHANRRGRQSRAGQFVGRRRRPAAATAIRSPAASTAFDSCSAWPERSNRSASSGGSVRLRLSPPELGSVRLEVSVKNGVLTAHAQTETTQARDALVDNLPALRERLAEQNIQVDQFDVDLFDSSSGGTSNQSQGNGDSSPGFTPTTARSAGRYDDRVHGGGSAAAGAAGGGSRRRRTQCCYLTFSVLTRTNVQRAENRERQQPGSAGRWRKLPLSDQTRKEPKPCLSDPSTVPRVRAVQRRRAPATPRTRLPV